MLLVHGPHHEQGGILVNGCRGAPMEAADMPGKRCRCRSGWCPREGLAPPPGEGGESGCLLPLR